MKNRKETNDRWSRILNNRIYIYIISYSIGNLYDMAKTKFEYRLFISEAVGTGLLLFFGLSVVIFIE